MLFKAMTDATRLKILTILSEEELCACDILAQVTISQPTLSHHMKVLAESELIHCRKDGSWMRYSLNKERIDEMQKYLEMLKQDPIVLHNNGSNYCC